MIVVFWLDRGCACHQVFGADALSAALRRAEELRARRRAGEPISHVTIQSELPDAVGAAGVGDAPGDYGHYKRRIDPAIPLGRPSGGRNDGG